MHLILCIVYIGSGQRILTVFVGVVALHYQHWSATTPVNKEPFDYVGSNLESTVLLFIFIVNKTDYIYVVALKQKTFGKKA